MNAMAMIERCMLLSHESGHFECGVETMQDQQFIDEKMRETPIPEEPMGVCA